MKIRKEEKTISVTKVYIDDGKSMQISVVHKDEEFSFVIPVTWAGVGEENSPWSDPDIIGNQTQTIINSQTGGSSYIEKDIVDFCELYRAHLDLYDSFQAVSEIKRLSADFDKAERLSDKESIAGEIDKWAKVIKAFIPSVKSRAAYDSDGAYRYLLDAHDEIMGRSADDISRRNYNNVF
jgi:hypothetical protein